MTEDIEKIATKVNNLLNALGVYLLNINFGQNFNVSYKSDGSPVSELDILIHNYVENYISLNLEGFKLISEESSNNLDSSPDYLIVLDPLDGTENFVSGIPIWAVGIAVFLNSELYAGTIYFPEIKKFDSSKNVKLDSTIGYTKFSSSLHTTRLHGLSSNHGEIKLQNLQTQEFRIYGSALFNLALTANGAIRYIPNPQGSWVWDIAPGLLLCMERGLEVNVNGAKYNGKFLDPTKRHFIKIR